MAGYSLTFNGYPSMGVNENDEPVELESTYVSNPPTKRVNITTFKFTADCGATTKEPLTNDIHINIKRRENFDDNIPTYNSVSTRIVDILETYTLRGWCLTPAPSSPYYYYDSQYPSASSIITLTKDTTLDALWVVHKDSTVPTYTFEPITSLREATALAAGYRFIGYSDKNLSTTIYKPGDTISLESYSYMFYEIFVPIIEPSKILKTFGGNGKFTWKDLIDNQDKKGSALYNFGGKESLWGYKNKHTEVFSAESYTRAHTFYIEDEILYTAAMSIRIIFRQVNSSAVYNETCQLLENQTSTSIMIPTFTLYIERNLTTGQITVRISNSNTAFSITLFELSTEYAGEVLYCNNKVVKIENSVSENVYSKSIIHRGDTYYLKKLS